MAKSTKQSKIMKKSYTLQITTKTKVKVVKKTKQPKSFGLCIESKEYDEKPYAYRNHNLGVTEIPYLQIGLYYAKKTNSLILIEKIYRERVQFRSCSFFDDLFTSTIKFESDQCGLNELNLIKLNENNINVYLDKNNNVGYYATKGEDSSYLTRTLTGASYYQRESTNLKKSDYTKYFN